MSYSTLKLLRNSMGQNRLNRLSLSNIHRDINMKIDDIIDKLEKMNIR